MRTYFHQAAYIDLQYNSKQSKYRVYIYDAWQSQLNGSDNLPRRPLSAENSIFK